MLSASPAEAETQLPFAALGDLLTDMFHSVADELPSPQRRALGAALLLDEAEDGALDRHLVAVAALTAFRLLAATQTLAPVAEDEGDFFADPLPSADVFIMGHILHDWSLEQKLTLLRSAYHALPDGGALIVYDAIIDDGRRDNSFGLLMSVNMLIETQQGFDYTAADCRSWMAQT